LDGKILDVNNSMLKMFAYHKKDFELLDLDILNLGKDTYTEYNAEIYLRKAIEGKFQVFAQNEFAES
jgi:hypothetical protein